MSVVDAEIVTYCHTHPDLRVSSLPTETSRNQHVERAEHHERERLDALFTLVKRADENLSVFSGGVGTAVWPRPALPFTGQGSKMLKGSYCRIYTSSSSGFMNHVPLVLPCSASPV